MSIKNIVFEQTGTIITGDFKGVDELNILVIKKNNIIYNMENHSSHPIAKSLCYAFKRL